MKRSFRWMITLLIIAAIAAGVGGSIYKAKKRMAAAPAWKPRPALVQTATVTQGDLSETIRYLARLEAVASTEIAPKISARIISLEVNEGDVVAAGDLLARLDDRDIRAQILAIDAETEAARAKLSGARAGTDAARNNLAFAQREYERDDSLFKKKGISGSALEASRNRLDEARAKASQAEESIRSIEQEIAARQAQRKEFVARLSYAEIRADYAGTIQKRYVEVGDMAMPGKPLFAMMDISSYKLGFDLVQEDLAKVGPGQTARIQWPLPVPEAFREKPVSRIFPSLESDQTVRAEIDLSCVCPEKMKVGSLIPVEVVVRKETGLIVPTNALVPDRAGGNLVYAVRNGSLTQLPVTVLLRNDGQTLIQGALSADDVVAVGEYLQWVRLHDGMAVPR